LTWKERERKKRRERKAAFVSLCLLPVSNIYFKYFLSIHVVKQEEIFLTAGWLMLSLSLSLPLSVYHNSSKQAKRWLF
jgi:hypothetical protein